MNYQETLDYLYSQLPIFQRDGKAAYKANLDNTLAFDRHLTSPHKHYKCIHVAGTNGKGSVSHMLASILQEQGYKTGLYTSPHYLDFRERIRVNGQCIDEASVVRFVEANKSFIDDIQPSFFELTVAMAFEYFRDAEVDVAVIEVGMGGRLDSTNIITPLVSIITNIGYDHQPYLGNTLPEIAKEKAGIIKPGVPVVIGETQEEITFVFDGIAKEQQSPMVYADAIYEIPFSLVSLDESQRFSVEKEGETAYADVSLDLLGKYQEYNVITVLCALDQVQGDLPVSKDAIYAGLRSVRKNTGFIGRFMHLGHNPRIICDAGHNKEGIAVVMHQLMNIPYKQLHVVLGFVNDKNMEGVLELFPTEAVYYYTRADIPRAMVPDDLMIQARAAGLSGRTYPSVCDALLSAEEKADVEDVVFIGGSTFVVAEAIKCKKNQKSVCI